MKHPKLPTIKDVALKAGVHYSTVSLALRGSASIPETTRERIVNVAKEMGYEPSAAMAALSRFRMKQPAGLQRSKMAFLVNQSPDLKFNQLPYLHQFIAGAGDHAAAIGYEFELLFVAEDQHDSESLHRYLQAQGIEGLIIGSFVPGFSGLTLDWSRYSVVKIDSLHLAPDCETVLTDQLQVTRLAFQRMSQLGYERIGLAVGRSDEDACRHRHGAGLLIEQAELPAERQIPPLLFPYNCDHPTARGLLSRWVKRHRIDAVLCNWLTIESMLRERGPGSPPTAASACLCLLNTQDPQAGVVTNLRLVGAKAVALLATQMRSGQIGLQPFPSITYVQGYWKDGTSAPGRKS